MKGRRHFRLLTLGALAVVLAGGGMMWSAVAAWREIGRLRESLTTAQAQNLQATGPLQASVPCHDRALDSLAAARQSLNFIQRAIAGAVLALLVSAGLGAYWIYRYEKNRPANDHQEWLASLGILAASVAHEIRNPLTAIKARLFTLRKAVAGSPAKTQELDFIGKEINRLEMIVREFLQFARPSQLQRAPVSPVELLREVADLLSPELRKLSINLSLVEATHTRLDGDPQQLKQVLINLVQNATKSIGKNGRITLRALDGRLTSARSGPPAVVLEVKDSGKGIPAEVQKNLFDPFFTTEKSGTGLGLPIAARIVEKHGGFIQFDTQINQGTTFRIVLPAAQEP